MGVSCTQGSSIPSAAVIHPAQEREGSSTANGRAGDRSAAVRAAASAVAKGFSAQGCDVSERVPGLFNSSDLW
jgi:hypothetical protein